MVWQSMIDRMEPWRELANLQRQMNRLFDDYSSPQRRAFPAVNVYANSDEVLVTAELPGIKQEDVNLSIMNNALTLEGSRKHDAMKEGLSVHRRERVSGEFARSIELPFAVNADKISAAIKNGVLTVRLPRREEDKPKSIQIQ